MKIKMTSKKERRNTMSTEIENTIPVELEEIFTDLL